jgi:hypothetical protein
LFFPATLYDATSDPFSQNLQTLTDRFFDLLPIWTNQPGLLIVVGVAPSGQDVALRY